MIYYFQCQNSHVQRVRQQQNSQRVQAFVETLPPSLLLPLCRVWQVLAGWKTAGRYGIQPDPGSFWESNAIDFGGEKRPPKDQHHGRHSMKPEVRQLNIIWRTGSESAEHSSMARCPIFNSWQTAFHFSRHWMLASKYCSAFSFLLKLNGQSCKPLFLLLSSSLNLTNGFSKKKVLKSNKLTTCCNPSISGNGNLKCLTFMKPRHFQKSVR